MPELSNQMYCSEQITIPPPFPYLLRQYAKAAIRTQPTDLLKWSTAYFRCLSLNIPPPVKPRLEYPIPRDFHGITPGWLKTLIYQLQNNQTVTFRVLWDRWTGACLEHDVLIKILCLGGFDNPQTIPWLKFVATCAAHLTDNLTNSMNLICEILTEEPEGGSAMIPLEIFLSLYKYLAKIDASKPQKLQNRYFTDSLLNLWKDRKEEMEKVEEITEISVKEEESLESIITEKESEEEIEFRASKEEISCPSLSIDENYSADYIIPDDEPETSAVQHVNLESLLSMPFVGEDGREEDQTFRKDVELREEEISLDDEDGDHDRTTEDQNHANKESIVEQNSDGQPVQCDDDRSAIPIADDEAPKQSVEDHVNEQNDDVEALSVKSLDTLQEIPPSIDKRFPAAEEDETLQEDLEKLKFYQQEIAGETDEEIEKYKCKLIEEMPLTESQLGGIAAFKPSSPVEQVESVKEVEEEEEEENNKVVYEEVVVGTVPGIGPKVPDDLIKAVCNYMKSVASIQHGMVMPRNIRHYNCPPLEILEYS